MSDYRKMAYAEATAAVQAFIADHPGYELEDEDPEVFAARLPRGTNFVLFGHHEDQPVVYKWYAADWGLKRFRNELAALEHFAATRCVPKIHAVAPDQLIVMDRLPGRFVDEEMIDALGVEGRQSLSRDVGRAVGELVVTPLPGEPAEAGLFVGEQIIPWDLDLEQAVNFYTDLCHRDLKVFPAGADPLYGESLYLVEAQAKEICKQRHIIFHEDLHFFSHRGRLAGIFDVEMCRYGTDLMQLERLFLQCGPKALDWESAFASFSAVTGRQLSEQDYVFLMAMAMFYFHIRITRWGHPNPEQDYVAQFLPSIRASALRYAKYVDLRAYLPSLV